MYASQISGNRWDGSRFVNTDGSGTPLTYKHLLTQLTFKAMKKVVMHLLERCLREAGRNEMMKWGYTK